MSGWETFTDAQALLGRLLSKRHDPARVTLLEAPAGVPLPEPRAQAPTRPAERLLYEEGPNALRVAWQIGEPGMLRVLESWDPGWRATVNGEPVPIYRADFLFMAVPVPAGPCEVRFAYRPASLRRGFVLSALGLAGILACFLPMRRRARPDPPTP
jgi:hypothetical protein